MTVAVGSSGINEWWRWDPTFIRTDTLGPLVGATVEVAGQQAGPMLTEITNSEGRLSYNLGATGLFDRCLRARFISGGSTSWSEEWPLTVVVTPTDPALAVSTRQIVWPYRTYLGGAQKQLEPFIDCIEVSPPSAPGLPPGGIPTEADIAERAFVPLEIAT